MKQKGFRRFLPSLVSFLVCGVILFAPFAVLYILFGEETATIPVILAIKGGLSAWNILYLCVISPKVHKKIKKLFEGKIDPEQAEAVEPAANELEAGKDEEDKAP